jgi:hypothetical protein
VTTASESCERRQENEVEFGVRLATDLVASCVQRPGETPEETAARAAYWLTAVVARLVVEGATAGVFLRGDLDIGGKKAFLKGNNP